MTPLRLRVEIISSRQPLPYELRRIEAALSAAMPQDVAAFEILFSDLLDKTVARSIKCEHAGVLNYHLAEAKAKARPTCDAPCTSASDTSSTS